MASKMTITFYNLFIPWDAEIIEDRLAKFLTGQGVEGRIEDSVTGNTTVFPIQDEDKEKSQAS